MIRLQNEELIRIVHVQGTDLNFDSRNRRLEESTLGGHHPADLAYRDFSGKPSDMTTTGAHKATKYLYGKSAP